MSFPLLLVRTTSCKLYTLFYGLIIVTLLSCYVAVIRVRHNEGTVFHLLQPEGVSFALHSLLEILHLTTYDEISSNENITIQAQFRGVDYTSLSRDTTLLDQPSSPHSLYEWKQPAVPQKSVPLEDFKFFVPSSNPTLGYTWWLIDPGPPERLGNFRYEPSTSSSKAAQFFSNVLSMFHRNVFLLTRAQPRGSVAIVSGIGNGTLDILFRVHAEFQLSQPPSLPCWFTPGQFSGRVVLGNNGKTLKYFNVNVPAIRRLNVDLEWLTSYTKDNEESIEVDIGFVPEMSLHFVGNKNISDVTWDQQLDVDDARQLLDRAFYRFLEVPYYNVSKALQKASDAKKLLHVIVSWGSLDDQSC